MIIGFVGKGGSGKSTLATAMVRYLQSHVPHVLAVDADHNMDLSYNLGVKETDVYVGNALQEIVRHAGYVQGEDYRTVLTEKNEPIFSLSPPDAFTERYSVLLENGTRVMIAGPHDERILYDKSCSHVLTTPLKVYLPFLALSDTTSVVVDEKAGADGVGTGVTTGFTLACVVVEPTEYSVKTGKLLAGLLEFYATPYVFLGNKIKNEDDTRFIGETLGTQPLAWFPLGFADSATAPSPLLSESLHRVAVHARELYLRGDTRIGRTRKKVERNQMQ